MKIKDTDKHGYKRILIVEVNWLGDVLFSTPFIRAIRNKFKDAYIACMTVPRCTEILRYNPHINEIIIYDEKGKDRSLFGKYRLVSFIRKKHFDIAIILHRSFTKALMMYLGGIKERIGYATKKRGFLLTCPIEPPDEILHKVEYFLKIAEALECDTSNKDYEFFITDKERDYIKEELSKNGVEPGDLLVVINPGANWPPKRWSEGNFAKVSDVLIKKYKAKVIISGADKDIQSARHIKEKMKENPTIFCGKTSLKELAGLMERADFVISGDSGPMHIAIAMKSNVIALFGPTSPAVTGPHGSGNYTIIQEDVGCEIPCYNLACDNCKCMEAIKPEDVLTAFDQMYSAQDEHR